MDDSTDSLWPSDLLKVKSRSPGVILMEQGVVLGKLTQNILQAKIITGRTNDWSNDIRFNFQIFAPALNYSLQLLSVQHSMTDLYPVTISSAYFSEHEVKAEDEEEFKRVLKSIFSEKKVQNAISALLAQSEGFEPVPF